MKFDVVLANPPFQDSERRGKTPHKLWIDFTIKVFDQWLLPNGFLGQVSPASFMSPSSKILKIMRKKNLEYVNFDTSRAFPGIGSTFAHYVIQNQSNDGFSDLVRENERSKVQIVDQMLYLPSDINHISLSIHNKVMFLQNEHLDVRHDYVACHNILLRTGTTLSKEKTRKHKYPVFHTNRQIWWSSVKQTWASELKVMWSRSGYTRPFFDEGEMGGTDMVYYTLVGSRPRGVALEKNLNSKLMQYIFTTAKWSGFGNEIVFESLPKMLSKKALDDDEIFDAFSLTATEKRYVLDFMG